MNSPLQQAVVPETLEGWAVLHETFRIDWKSWKRLHAEEREGMLAEAVEFLNETTRPEEGQSAIFSLLGHKGDLLLLHFRRTFDQLQHLQLSLRQLPLSDYWQPADSYVSFVELGLYEMTVKLHQKFLEEGLAPGSEEWNLRWKAEIDQTAQRMKERIFPTIPENRYFCFYPMNKRRGETVNWYRLPIEKRQTLMHEHGMIGRKYHGKVKQIITGSIGYDDWEWGVYLFADDPVVFKKLIYEIRFDEASAPYAEFGPFWSGLQFSPDQLPRIFAGQTANLEKRPP